MTREDIADVVRAVMPAQLYNKPGAILLSGASTLRPSHVYVMGLNPGGDPGAIPAPMIETVAPLEGTSCYTHECWQPGCREPQPCRHMGADGATLESALVKHQKNMIALTKALGGTPATIFSANAVFGRSTELATLKAQTCVSLVEWWTA